VIHPLDDWLYRRYNLKSAGAVSNDCHGFVGNIEGCIPVSGVNEFPLELVQAGKLWPRPRVEESSRFDEDI
jgi:hypothetical protein